MSKDRFSKDLLGQAIAELYDTAVLTDDWNAWVRTAANQFGGVSAVFSLADQKTGIAEIVSATGIAQRPLEEYSQYYNRHDIWAQRCARDPMKALTSADIVSDREFAESEIFVDFYKRQPDKIFYVLGSVFSVGSLTGAIGFHKVRDAGQFSREHAKGLDLLLPHIRRAYLIRARLRQNEAERATSLGALDQIDHGGLPDYLYQAFWESTA